MEQILDAPVAHVLGEIVEVVRFFVEHIHQRTVEEIVDVPVPLILELFAEVIKVILLVRVSARIVAQVVDVPVLLPRGDSCSISGRIHPRTVEEIVDVLVPDPGAGC